MEFAIVFPSIVLILLAAVQLIIMMGSKIALQNAAFEAVRVASVKSSKGMDDARSAAEETVKDRLKMTFIGPGFFAQRATIGRLEYRDGKVLLTLNARVSPLPMIGQAVGLFGMQDGIPLSTTASARLEPFTGEQP